MNEYLSSYAMMDSKAVVSYLQGRVMPVAGSDSLQRKSYIDTAILKLNSLISSSEIKEKQAYKIFGCTDLEGMQRKLDEINQSGLLAFSNKALQAFPAIKQAKGVGSSSQADLKRIIEQEFIEYLMNNKQNNASEIIEINEEEMLQTLERFFKSKGTRLTPQKLGITFKQGSTKLIFQKFTKTQKQTLKKHFKTSTKTFASDSGWQEMLTITTEDDLVNSKNQLLSYPYYGLTQEEKKEAETNIELWELFIKAVGRCAGKSKNLIENTMREMGIGAFISSGGSYADIVGIFGELQALAFLKSFNIDTQKARFLGHEKNQSGQKIGIDMALEDIGFQVKNYNTYGSRGIDEGINLRGTYKLSTFLDMISSGLSLGGAKEDLEMFYAMSAFHISIHKDFDTVEKWMDTIKKENLPNLYNAAIAEILPVKQISWIANEQEELATNYFYIVGGTRILPVSKILGLYVLFLKDLREKIYNRRILTSSITKYTGPTYKNYHEDSDNFDFPGYDTIAEGLSINYTINLNIDYILEQVLSKINSQGLEV